MVNYWVLIIFGLAILVAFLWRRLTRHGKGEKRHITFEEMCQWGDERILTVSSEELVEDKRKLQLFNVVSEHENDKHGLRKYLTPHEYAGYVRNYRALKARAQPEIRDIYENLVRQSKEEHDKRQGELKEAV